jgi:glyoxylase-like metal-dependent hydrolase (beta-lactamase superfamily II)
MTAIALEDNCTDIINKARRGLGLSEFELMAASGLSMLDIRAVLDGRYEEDAVFALAVVLQLAPERLLAIATAAWRPQPAACPGLQTIHQPWPAAAAPAMWVNGYSLACGGGGMVCVDPGPRLEPWLQTGLQPRAVLLTHAHPDHVAALPAMLDRWPDLPVHAHSAEAVDGALPVREGDALAIGTLRITAHLTPGHSNGGLSFIVAGLPRPLVCVGDALFAGSVGGIRQDYPRALGAIREHILSLPAETIICPGHGPLTTVGELNHNPFFP